ncbi:hypothetical protein CR513_20967, partial [Mucuna pruriens]
MRSRPEKSLTRGIGVKPLSETMIVSRIDQETIRKVDRDLEATLGWSGCSWIRATRPTYCFGRDSKKLGFLELSLEECLGMLIVEIHGVINLEIILGTCSTMKMVKMRFTVVNILTSYNVILGRSALNRLRAIVSTTHLCMKYLVDNLVGVKADREDTPCHRNICESTSWNWILDSAERIPDHNQMRI